VILQGDIRDIAPTLPSESVQCIVTSPPYWGLRDYGVDGQLGLEATPEEYVANLVGIFHELRRVLRDDGTLWLNLGDSYATGAGKVGDCPGGGPQGEAWKKHFGKSTPGSTPAMYGLTQPNRMPIPGLKPKDLVGIPWRVAFALQADGWWLRQDIIWAKPNPMPESVTDRCTKSHEYIFLLTKSARYYYDAEAIKEPSNGWRGSRFGDGKSGENGIYHRQAEHGEPIKVRSPAGWKTGPGNHGTIHEDGREQEVLYVEDTFATRNRRSVWTIATAPYKGAHFATFPPDLVRPCILAGCPAGGTVLDPFMGSGTVAQVAIETGRNWLGVELKPGYIELAWKRIREAAGQSAFPLEVA
jgi:DNA modification methylase